MGKILLTGCCGFIGSKVGEILLQEKSLVLGIDEINDYYDVRLKEWRLAQLKQHKNFSFIKQDISSPEIKDIVKSFSPDAIINLAARAGVRCHPTVKLMNCIYNYKCLSLSNFIGAVPSFSPYELFIFPCKTLFYKKRIFSFSF